MANGERAFEMVTTDINPVIKKSKFMSIPNGFSLANKTITLNVDFPNYWMKSIMDERDKRPYNRVVSSDCS